MSATTIFGNTIVIVIALALVVIALAAVSMARSHKTEAKCIKYYTVMNHLGLYNQLSAVGNLLDDETLERTLDTIEISKKYMRKIAPEEYKED